MKHASIIPLIGGETIGVEEATGSPPSYMVSWRAFEKNDSHAVNYYRNNRGVDLPYHFLDEGDPSFSVGVDSVSSVCPCAGLSALSRSPGADNPANDWMYRAAEWVLDRVKPAVYWGENAPALMSASGEGVRNKLLAIAADKGYTCSFYRTKSSLHGLSQVRNRSFYFMWKGNRAPVFSRFERPPTDIKDTLLSATGNYQTEPINQKTPSVDDPYYAYVLSEIGKGATHAKFVESYRGMPVRNNDVISVIEDTEGHDLNTLLAWLKATGRDKGAAHVERIISKIAVGKGVMHRNTVLPKGVIGAFVSHYPYMLTHPVEDRYISYREAMTVMGLPQDFELLDPKRSVNHICQNVPVRVAADMASEVQACLGSPSEREWWEGTVMQNNLSGRVEVDLNQQSLSNFF